MEIWLDTINVEAVKAAYKMGLLTGVTTNPSLLAKSTNSKITIEELLKGFKGLLAVQVMGKSSPEMAVEGESLRNLSQRLIVKVPVTQAGLAAIHALTAQSIPTMATCVFTAEQALMAAKAGASYVALYLTRLEKSGGDATLLLEKAMRLFTNYQVKTKLLAASISNIDQIEQCLDLGISAVTLSESLFNQFTADNPLTLEAIRQFEAAHKAEDASLFKPRILA